MAIFRPIQISFWQDPYILTLSKEQKYFYIYLMTNSKTTQCGIYEISEKIVQLETDINEQGAIKGLIRGLQADGKVLFDDKTSEIMLLNWVRYNEVNNQNIEKRIVKELKGVKCRNFIDIFIELINKSTYKAPIINNFYEGLTRGLQGATKKPTPTSTPTPIPTGTSTQVATPSPNLKLIIETIQESINPNINPFEIELVQKWVDDHPEDIILAALKETALAKATSLKYTDKILISWKQKNIKSIQDVERMKQSHENKVGGYKKGYETPEPDWMAKHEENRRNSKDIIEDVDPAEVEKLLKSFSKK